MANVPAQKVCLRAGAVITHIDGGSVTRYSPEQARDYLRGKVRTLLRLSVVRNDKPLADEIVVKRAPINIR